MKLRIKYITAFALLYYGLATALGQTWSLHGQASGWLAFTPDNSRVAQTGLRYIPELTIEPKSRGNLGAEVDLSLNNYTTASFTKSEHPEGEGKIKPYRAWFSLASNTLEVRIGLQKINFGSATLFRSLMWFDKIDPRDPLQLTDGVYGLLVRYYFLNNANIWLWGLCGNDKTKGWEIVPTRKKSVEYGGRVQTILGTGEVGFSYHHRQADFSKLTGLPITAGESFVPENRYALDGKWDIGIGAWLEAVLIHTQSQIPGMKYQRYWTVGVDYTFGIGNGLTVLTEYFRLENPDAPFRFRCDGHGFSALSLSYPRSLRDRLSCMLFRDWTTHEWYRLVTWQRTYDNWILYLLGFWNPQQIQLYRTREGSNPFAGTGIQLMVVFNH
ncbi:MAG: hypothetical protein ONB44_18885 [candidate division KSB1 bacterium]|nr:hypothetical protein [candidate division KSB1 bacterium]MDZ7304197.1 hypothetical protein [candidate division KSB1 bacterium]MDZ7313433.1 hypothetical protein [candidate division KSB1 bacterium]